jgi:hypothetical protein
MLHSYPRRARPRIDRIDGGDRATTGSGGVRTYVRRGFLDQRGGDRHTWFNQYGRGKGLALASRWGTLLSAAVGSPRLRGGDAGAGQDKALRGVVRRRFARCVPRGKKIDGGFSALAFKAPHTLPAPVAIGLRRNTYCVTIYHDEKYDVI